MQHDAWQLFSCALQVAAPRRLQQLGIVAWVIALEPRARRRMSKLQHRCALSMPHTPC